MVPIGCVFSPGWPLHSIVDFEVVVDTGDAGRGPRGRERLVVRSPGADFPGEDDGSVVVI